MASDHLSSGWPVLFGAIVLAAPVWWRSLRSSVGRSIDPTSRNVDGLSIGEAFYFFVTPILLGWAVYQVAPGYFDLHPGLVPLIVAVPYLLAGYTADRKSFALVGTTAILIAVLLRWSGIEAAWALLALAVLWAAIDHALHRTDGRWYGLLAGGCALVHLLYVDLPNRGADPAFVGTWALALWASAVVFALYAKGLWREVEGEGGPSAGSPALFWSIAGLILLFGVTGEIYQYYELSGLPPLTANLARGLVVSAWWIVFAAGLVILGLRRGIKPIRVAGLLVSGMAVLKVVLFDLSTLDALYRVGSVLCLGVVSLGLAYIYNRRAREAEKSG
jgi:hypothetical protein